MTKPVPPQVFEPLRTQPNAMEVFLLGLALFSALQIIFLPLKPLSVDVLLGPVWAFAWASMLLGGGITALAGLFWPGRSITGVALQQLGYVGYAIASLARTVALIEVGRSDEVPVVLGFALAAGIRVLQLELRVARVSDSHPSTKLRAAIRRFLRRGAR